MSATPKILNIGLNIKTNNISVTVNDSTEFNVFSNFILNIIISDIIKKMLLASGTIFDINPNFQTILKGNAKHNVYEFISYPKNTIDIDDDVFKTSLQYYIELLILSSSKNLKFTNSLINSNYPFFQLDSGELIL